MLCFSLCIPPFSSYLSTVPPAIFIARSYLCTLFPSPVCIAISTPVIYLPFCLPVCLYYLYLSLLIPGHITTYLRTLGYVHAYLPLTYVPALVHTIHQYDLLTCIRTYTYIPTYYIYVHTYILLYMYVLYLYT